MEDITLTLDDINNIGLLGILQDGDTVPAMDELVRRICLICPVEEIKKRRTNNLRGADQYQVSLKIDGSRVYEDSDNQTKQALKKVKQLENLVIFLLLNGKGISPEDIELASKYLETSGIVKGRDELKTNAEIDSLYDLIEADLGIKRDEILSKGKTRRIAKARHIVGYLMRQKYHLSYPEIGRRLGGKNHTTILLAEQKNFKDGHPEGTYAQLSLQEAYNLAKSSYKT